MLERVLRDMRPASNGASKRLQIVVGLGIGMMSLVEITVVEAPLLVVG